MKRILYTPAAQSDINGIYDFSAERWNLEQAEDYIDTIKTVCAELAQGLKKGRDASHIRVGYLKKSVKSHMIFYRQTETVLEVIRILHQSRDFDRHF